MKNKCDSAVDILQQKREELISNFLKGKESDFLRKHAQILDEYFCEIFKRNIINVPYAIVALGGYGRREQCIHSDIDILLLFEKNIPSQAEKLVRDFFYPLWDVGFDVGHASRTLSDCVNLSNTDFEVLTSLLDGRFICGASFLCSELGKRLWKEIISKKSNEIVAWLIETNQERHKRFGDSTYLLEPNLKMGQGGLRDYHTMLWIARVKFDLKSPRDLEYNGNLSQDEFQGLKKALSFIWNVRNRLHYLSGKKNDQLYFEYQIKLSKALNFHEKDGQQPVERFLGKLHGKMEFIKQHRLIFINEQQEKQNHKTKKQRNSANAGLEVKRNMLYFSCPEAILNSPILLMEIFDESANLQIPLSAEAKRLVKEFSYLVDENFRTSALSIILFEHIVLVPAPEFNVLNEMLNTGFLSVFIPEIRKIVNRIQYDEYHLYPVDKHLLRTIQIIKAFEYDDVFNCQLCKNLYEKLADKKPLLWAALFHDIGKGESSKNHSQRGAEIIRPLLAKRGFTTQNIEIISFLIREHLLLIKTATRRDLNDEASVVFCARKIKNVERLNMLYLLTVADSMATGPKAWNNWTSSLLNSLLFKVANVLENGELATNEATQLVEKKKKELLAKFTEQAKQELESFLNTMSPRYLLYISAYDIVEHIKMRKSLKNDNFVWKIDKSDDLNTRTVTICAKDHHGLFSQIAGVFTLNNIEILDVQAYTLKKNIALDIFKVKPPLDLIFENEKWDKAKENLEAVISGKLDIGVRTREKMQTYHRFKPYGTTKPHKVIVNNDYSVFFTIIEVFTYNFHGLLFSITDALFKLGLNVSFAKIATQEDQVVDIFYVRDFDGQKINSPDQMATIKKTILENLKYD